VGGEVASALPSALLQQALPYTVANAHAMSLARLVLFRLLSGDPFASSLTPTQLCSG
jgi:hypothetical protein